MNLVIFTDNLEEQSKRSNDIHIHGEMGWDLRLKIDNEVSIVRLISSCTN